MSKAIVSVLTIGAAIAVNVIPGAGQAISAFLLGTVGLSVGTAVAIGTAIPGVLAAAGAVAGLSLAGSVLFAPPARRPDTTEQSRKTPIPPRTRAYGQLRLYGSWILYSWKSDGAPVDVWAFHDGRASAILQVYLNDDKVTISGGVVQQLADKRYRDSKVLAGYNLGAPIETAHAAVVAALPGIWTADHRGDDVVTGYLIKQLQKSDRFLETYPNGDDIQMSLAGQWTPVFDFRDGGQSAGNPATWEYRDNGPLAFLHYLITERGYDYETQILPQLAKWSAAANDADLGVPLKAGGMESRYRLALAYNATEQPASVVSAILQTFDGWYCENERGEVIVYSGRFYVPTVSVGPDQIVSYSFQRHVAAEDAVNEVTITYVNVENEYNTVDAQSWRDQAAIDASGRAPVTSPLEAQIPSASQGRRLAKRKMIRANAPCRGSVSTTYGGREALGERYINLRIEEAGAVFYDGPVEIIGTPERDMQTGGVRFDWIAADPNIDAWDPSEEEGDATPVGGNPDITDLVTPEITDVDVQFDTNGSAARAVITVTSPDRSDLTWRLLWRVTSDTGWNEQLYSNIPSGTLIQLVSPLLPVDVGIDAQVRYGTGDGRQSELSAVESFSTGTAALAPAQATGFNVTPGAPGAGTATWTNPTSSNLAKARLYRNTTNAFGTAVQVGPDHVVSGLGAPDMINATGLPAGATYFFLTMVSAAGVEGAPLATGAIAIA